MPGVPKVAATASIALIGATLSALLRAPLDDGFPLSTYPMFASVRPSTLAMSYALAIGPGDTRRAIAPELVGSAEPLQAMAILDAASADAASTRALCEVIAGRVGRAPALAGAREVRIVTGTHDAVAYLVDHRLGTEEERVRCAVPR